MKSDALRDCDLQINEIRQMCNDKTAPLKIDCNATCNKLSKCGEIWKNFLHCISKMSVLFGAQANVLDHVTKVLWNVHISSGEAQIQFHRIRIFVFNANFSTEYQMQCTIWTLGFCVLITRKKKNLHFGLWQRIRLFFWLIWKTKHKRKFIWCVSLNRSKSIANSGLLRLKRADQFDLIIICVCF